MRDTPVARVESMLGRRLRPWWGQAPSRLVIGGLVGVVVAGLVIYGSIQVRAGELDLSGTGLDDQRSTIDRVALVVAALAALGIVYNLIRFVVGILDLTGREVVDGVVVSSRQRRSGDFLPWYVQRLWYRRDNSSGMSREMGRRTRYEVVLQTPNGTRSWNVRPGQRLAAQEGARVRLSATRILGYVRRIEPLDQH